MDKPSKFYTQSYGLVSFLVESEINLNARYSRPELKDQFYKTVNDKLDWTQEHNLTIKEPNTFFYNDIYSYPVSKSIGRTLPSNYSKAESDTQQDSENGVIYSNVDSDENSFYDPWLIYKEFNFKELKKKYGKLIQLKGIENENILARFENGQLVFNTTDLLTSQNNAIVVESGSGSVFDKRPQELRFTDLGFQGTQHSDMVSTPYGHFTVDAKRGQVFLGNDVISDVTGGKDSGMKSWFREQLPFKILKQFPQIDIDNKFKGIGLSMGYDNRFGRILLTKKDYILKTTANLLYVETDGFYTVNPNPTITCPVGFTYNTVTQKCQKITESANLCPTGYAYNASLGTCTLTTTTQALCFPEIVSRLKRSTTKNGLLVDFTNFSLQGVKCHYESYLSAPIPVSPDGVSGVIIRSFTPLAVGVNIYSSLSPYNQIQSAFNGNYLYNEVNFEFTQILTVTNGMITNITNLSSLAPC
jgi:hypothetical protein